MPQLQKIAQGTPPSGVDGDTVRTAFAKVNANSDVLAACVALGYNILSDNWTLAPSNVGTRFGLNMGAGGKVVKLPLASSVSVNACVHFFNVGPPVTMGFQGNDGSQVNLLNTGDWATFIADGGTYWHVAERGRLLPDEVVSGFLTVAKGLTVGGDVVVKGGFAGNLNASGKIVAVNSPNLLLNGSAEIGVTGGWGPSGFVDAYTGGTAEGTYFSNKTPINANSWAGSNPIAVGANTPLTLSGEIHAGGVTAGSVWFRMVYLNSAGGVIGTSPNITTTNGYGWVFRSDSRTTPAGTASVYVQLGVEGSPPAVVVGGVSWRRLKLELGSAPSLYSQEATIAYLGGAPVFSGVPKFGQYVPWHGGNLNPASLVSDQTFKGTNIFEKSILSSFAPADYGSILVATRAVGYAFNDWGKSSAVVRVECDNNQAAYQIVHAQKTGQRDLFAMTVYAGGSANSNPMASFTFTGTVNAHQFYDGGNAVFVGSLSQGSDYRIKALVENIDPAAAYDGVRRLRFVDYLKTTNVGKDAERRIAGVIAHEAQEVFSNVVSGEKDAVEDDGRLKLQTVDYNGLGIYVGAAVQHMANLIESLRSDVVKLRAEVAMLRGGR